MKLIHIHEAAAAGGTARIYQRGTSTEVGYYSDFEGNTSVAAGTQVALNAYGAAKLYVDQYVRVVVKNALDVTVADYVDGDSASATELRSPSFTGTAYVGGATAPGNPLTVKTALDMWVASAGAVDFEVLIGGSAVSIEEWAANSAGIFFNVKNTAYSGGAAGDGVADDTNPIEDAIAAAAVLGGIVFFPAGEYRTTLEIAVPENVTLLGVGVNASIINCAASGIEDVFSCDSADGTGARTFRDITIRKSAGCSGAYVNGGDVEYYVDRCDIGGGTFENGHTLAGTAKRTVTNSTIRCTLNRSAVYASTRDDAELVMSDSVVIPQAGAWGVGFHVIQCGNMQISNCEFQASGVTGTMRVIDGQYGGSVVGCRFRDPTVGELLTCLTLPESGTGYVVNESANQFGDGANPGFTSAYRVAANEFSDSLLGSMATRWLEIVSGGTSVAYPHTYSQHGTWVVRHTGASNTTFTVTLPFPLAENQRLTLLIIEDPASGSALTVTVNNGVANEAGAILTPAAGGGAGVRTYIAATRVASSTTTKLLFVPLAPETENLPFS